MSRLPTSRTGPLAGSAGVARARLHSAIARDRSSRDPRPAGAPAAPAHATQPDLLDLLLAQAGGTGRGRP